MEHFKNALGLLVDHGVVAGDLYIIEKMTTCEVFFLFIGPIKEIIISSWRPCQKREEVDWKLDNKSQPNNGYFLRIIFTLVIKYVFLSYVGLVQGKETW